MKKIYITFLCLFSCIFSSNSFAESVTGASTMNSITEMMLSMAGHWAIETDVAKYRIAYYNDQIFLYGADLAVVLKESVDWARSELWKVISKRLYSLKGQWFLSNENYDKYMNSYSSEIGTGWTTQFWTVYRDFIRFEKEVVDTEIPRAQDALYNKFKDRLTELLKAHRITQEKYNTWLVKIDAQVYQYKSDPNLMSLAFEEEAARYTTIIESAPDYLSEAKAQYEKKYSKMSLKNLQLTLTRTKKLEKKYAEWSKNKLKIQAQIELLNQEIAKKVNNTTARK